MNFEILHGMNLNLHKFSSFKVFFEKGALNTRRGGGFMRIPITHPHRTNTSNPQSPYQGTPPTC